MITFGCRRNIGVQEKKTPMINLPQVVDNGLHRRPTDKKVKGYKSPSGIKWVKFI